LSARDIFNLMKKLLFICFSIVLLVKQVGAQEQLSVKQMADKLYERFEYFKSVNLYLKLVKNKTDVQVLERIADCYLNINRYADAEKWYAKAAADPKANPVTHFYYAEVLLRDQKFDLAKEQYKQYYNNDATALSSKLANCDSAALWMKQPSAYTIKNDSIYNSQYSDWGVNYDGKTGTIFTSDRKADDSKIDNRTGNNWFKLYNSDFKSHAINQLQVSNIISNVFSDDYHVGPIALNTAADTAYITITTGLPKKQLPADKVTRNAQNLYTRRLQLLIANKTNGQWTVFSSFPYNNVQNYSVGDADLSKDGKIIYFTSDMPGGEGKTDIWYCEKQRNGSWGKPSR